MAYAGAPVAGGPARATDTLAGLDDDEDRKRGPGSWVVLALVGPRRAGALAYGLSTYFGEPDVAQGRRAARRRHARPDGHRQARPGQAGRRRRAPAQRHGPEDARHQPEPRGRAPRSTQNSTVKLFVSSGPTAVTVPDLKGLTVQEAQSQLSDQGLAVGTVEEVDDPDTEQGKIIDSNPGAGTSVAPADQDQPARGHRKVEVPNVVGKSQSEAQTIIAGVNLQVETEVQGDQRRPRGHGHLAEPQGRHRRHRRHGQDHRGPEAGADPHADDGDADPDHATDDARPRPRHRPLTPTSRIVRPPMPHGPLDRRSGARRSAGGDHPGDAGGVVHERAQADRALDGIRHAAQLRASWRASGARRG